MTCNAGFNSGICHGMQPQITLAMLTHKLTLQFGGTARKKNTLLQELLLFKHFTVAFWQLVLPCCETRGRAALPAGTPLPSQNLFQEPPEMKSYGFVETDICLYVREHVTFQDHYIITSHVL